MQKSIAFTIALALAANAQKIETEKSDRNKVIRVETAPNHLSVIELSDPVTEVAAGVPLSRLNGAGKRYSSSRSTRKPPPTCSFGQHRNG